MSSLLKKAKTISVRKGKKERTVSVVKKEKDKQARRDAGEVKKYHALAAQAATAPCVGDHQTNNIGKPCNLVDRPDYPPGWTICTFCQRINVPQYQ